MPPGGPSEEEEDKEGDLEHQEQEEEDHTIMRKRTCRNKVIHSSILFQQFQPSTLISAMFLAQAP